MEHVLDRLHAPSQNYHNSPAIRILVYSEKLMSGQVKQLPKVTQIMGSLASQSPHSSLTQSCFSRKCLATEPRILTSAMDKAKAQYTQRPPPLLRPYQCLHHVRLFTHLFTKSTHITTRTGDWCHPYFPDAQRG